MMKCRSGIMREYKTRKADSAHPNSGNYSQLPECDGEVTITAHIEASPSWGGTSYELDVEIECQRCKFPYVENWNEFRHEVVLKQRLDVTVVLEKWEAI